MTSHTQSAISELKAMEKFIDIGYNIYYQLTGREPFDFIAERDGKLLRVEVKSTNHTTKNGKAYIASIKATRMKANSIVRRRFDVNQCDVLAVYICPLDTMCFLLPHDVKVSCNIRFRKNSSPNANKDKKAYLIDKCTDLEKVLAGRTGIEPATNGFGGHYSA